MMRLLDAYLYKRCTRKHDNALLQVMESVPLGSPVKLCYTARPSYLEAAQAMGKPYVYGAFLRGSLAGFGSVILQQRYLDGKPIQLGYLSALRVLPEHRGKGLVSRAFAFLKQQRLGAPLYFASIIDSNKFALKILTKRREGYPYFRPIGIIETSLLIGRARAQHEEVSVGTLRESDKEAALKFLQYEGRKKQFFPHYVKLENRNLAIHNYIVAKRKKTLVGICSVWNQAPFKQIIVKDYGYLEPFIKLYSAWPVKNSSVKLPGRGEKLDFSFISNLAIHNNDPSILRAMILHIQHLKNQSPFLAIGLDLKDPLRKALSGLPRIKYKSRLFTASWNEKGYISSMNKSTFYPEISML